MPKMWLNIKTCRFLAKVIQNKMTLEELRKKVIYQNSIEIWIGASKEKNIDWYDTENYKKFIAFLLQNNLNMKQMSICFDGHLMVVTAKKYSLTNWQHLKMRIQHAIQ